jgi:hypothetical protein
MTAGLRALSCRLPLDTPFQGGGLSGCLSVGVPLLPLTARYALALFVKTRSESGSKWTAQIVDSSLRDTPIPIPPVPVPGGCTEGSSGRATDMSGPVLAGGIPAPTLWRLRFMKSTLPLSTKLIEVGLQA